MYQQKLNELRNQLHKEIVQQSIKVAGAADDLQLELTRPIEEVGFQVNEDLHTRTLIRFRLTGIDCNTGELLAETYDFESRRIRYCDLTLEQLGLLHDYLTNQKFTVNQLEPCY